MTNKILQKIVCISLGIASTVLAGAEINPIAYIHEEVAKGNKHIVVPQGKYLLESEARAPYLKFVSLKDTCINLTGVKFIGAKQYTMVSLEKCENVTIKGLTIDYQDLPFTQGVITEVDSEQNWTIEVIEGYPYHDIKSAESCWPIQAYGKETLELVNPMRFRNNIQVVKTGNRSYRITGGEDKRGEVGDIVVFSIHDPSYQPIGSACVLSQCKDCTLEDFVIYSTPYGVGVFSMLSSRTTLNHCRLIRCPEEQDLAPRKLKRLRSGNHDAFMFRVNGVGPRIINCTALYHCDDCVNISGYGAVVFASNGTHLRIASHLSGPALQAGNSGQVVTHDGECLNGLGIKSVTSSTAVTPEEREFLHSIGFWPGFEEQFKQAYDVELDALPAKEIGRGSFISNENSNGNDFVIRGCHLGRTRGQGILLRASNGVIENNFLDGNTGPGIGSSADIVWLESGSSHNVSIIGNVFNGNLSGGIRIGGTATHGKPLKPSAHVNFRIEDNLIMGPRNAIELRGCSNAVVRDNTFKLEEGKKGVVVGENCSDCKVDYSPVEK